ncbi:hypothetical protein [Natronorarus salvus]|uniref:hypothetical protein n=1 Tax=Natronorarus salvus TaxID=3117733 RepID=UPI002F2644FE
MRRVHALAAVCLLVVVVAGVGMVVAADPVVFAPTNSGGPGETVEMDLQVLNDGEAIMTGTSITLDPGDAPVSVETGETAIGTIPEGEIVPTTALLTVDDDADPGEYTMEVIVEYTDDGDGETLVQEIAFTVEDEDAPEPDAAVFAPASSGAPGESVEAEVQLLNTGTAPLESTSISLDEGGAPLSVRTGATGLGTVEPSVVSPATFQVDVDRDAAPGTYTLEATIEYVDDGETETITRDVEFTVDERARFAVTGSSTDTVVGESGTMTIDVENVGSETANAARITATSTSGQFTIEGDAEATRSAGDLEPGEAVALQYDVEVAPDGSAQPYDVRVSTEYEDDAGVTREGNPLSTGVAPAGAQSFAIDGIESTLRVGDEGTVTGRLTNEGPNAVEDVVITATSETGTLGLEEAEYAVDSLGPGESVDFSFDVSVGGSEHAGTRFAEFGVEYRTAGGDRYRYDEASAIVAVAPDDEEFSVEAVNNTVEAGGSTTFEVNVTNEREYTVGDVNARVFADSPLSESDDEAYVSEIAPGETATLRFTIDAEGGAMAKEYPVSIDFQYANDRGERRLSDTYQLPVSVTEPSDDDGFPFVILAALLVALLGLALLGRQYWPELSEMMREEEPPGEPRTDPEPDR